MEIINKQYHETVCTSETLFFLDNRYYNVNCGCYYNTNNVLYHRFMFNYRKWDFRMIQTDISSISKLCCWHVPPHYFYTQLIPELPYKANDIIFWQWILSHFLGVHELRLKIIYFVILWNL